MIRGLKRVEGLHLVLHERDPAEVVVAEGVGILLVTVITGRIGKVLHGPGGPAVVIGPVVMAAPWLLSDDGAEHLDLGNRPSDGAVQPPVHFPEDELALGRQHCVEVAARVFKRTDH